MTLIPELLREAMSDFGMTAVEAWWTDLSEPARLDVIELWRTTSFDQRSVACVEAHPVSAHLSDDHPSYWHNDFYEYLINHEVYLIEEPGPHVCTQHPTARAAARTGFIPSTFSCPFAHRDCPMRQLLQLSGHQSPQLRLAFRPKDHLISALVTKYPNPRRSAFPIL